ncbi:MAG: mechanosensitive ion channel [Methylococcaceae bacterium]|nr:MAG: mechanosensitive ion channel [Methylococcaceae bacterium]
MLGKGWQNYGHLSFLVLMLGALLFFKGLFIEPIAYIIGSDPGQLEKAIMALTVFLGSLLTSRWIRLEVVHGLLERRFGSPVPPLLGDVAGFFVVITGLIIIVSWIYNKDVTSFLATGGVGLMIIGVSLRDMILAVFTGALLNLEKIFEMGDEILVNNVKGRVSKTTWRTTTIISSDNLAITIPNMTLGNAVIINYHKPTSAELREHEVCIDYSTSVDSAERLLMAAALGAEGVKLALPPRVFAKRMDPNGIVYGVRCLLTDHDDWRVADHAIIRSILTRMRDAGVSVAYPKREIVQMPMRVGMADRSLDRYFLISHCRLFHDLSEAARQEISQALVEHHCHHDTVITESGERRDSLFIVGEGMVIRDRLSNDDDLDMKVERLVPTEFFGCRALFAGEPQIARAKAATTALVYELDKPSMTKIIMQYPEITEQLARSLAAFEQENTGESSRSQRFDRSASERGYTLWHGRLENVYGKCGKSDVSHRLAESV